MKAYSHSHSRSHSQRGIYREFTRFTRYTSNKKYKKCKRNIKKTRNAIELTQS